MKPQNCRNKCELKKEKIIGNLENQLKKKVFIFVVCKKYSVHLYSLSKKEEE